MKTQGCAYCCGDLTRVDGLLGPDYFCPACRRFQPRAAPRNTMAPKRDKPRAQSGDEEAGKSTGQKNHSAAV